MNITVIGMGYVGVTTAALLAHSDHTVFAIEPLKKRFELLKQGRAFFYEDGVDELLGKAISGGSLIPTSNYLESVSRSEVVFCCMGTPDMEDGSSDLRYVMKATEIAAQHMKDGAIFVQKSTVPVGTGRKLEEVLRASNGSLRYVSNPEFLREGTSILDSLWFDRAVSGSTHTPSADKILDLYRQLILKRDEILSLSKIPAPSSSIEPKYYSLSRESAELVKVTANAFLALKISFANSIAKLADQSQGNISEVMQAVGADPRIGEAFLIAGHGYGGGCFPKDVSGLIASSEGFGAPMEIMEAAQQVNESMPRYIVEKIKDTHPDLRATRIGLLGLSFKPNTSDHRRSPSVTIANLLASEGAAVTCFDPQVNKKEIAVDLDDDIKLVDELEECIDGVEILVICTPWKIFKQLNLEDVRAKMSGNTLVDTMNSFNESAVSETGLQYIGVGNGSVNNQS